MLCNDCNHFSPSPRSCQHRAIEMKEQEEPEENRVSRRVNGNTSCSGGTACKAATTGKSTAKEQKPSARRDDEEVDQTYDELDDDFRVELLKVSRVCVGCFVRF